jgi:hypothetical protein
LPRPDAALLLDPAMTPTARTAEVMLARQVMAGWGCEGARLPGPAAGRDPHRLQSFLSWTKR